jgi:hypothetical protein
MQHSFHCPVIPPLALTCCPLTHLAFSDTNRSVVSAISAVVPTLSAALVASNSGWIASSRAPGASGMISVATGPGATEFTVIPRLLPNWLERISNYYIKGDKGGKEKRGGDERKHTSAAQAYVKESTAAFVAPYMGMLGRPILEAMEVMLMIRPPGGIRGTTA